MKNTVVYAWLVVITACTDPTPSKITLDQLKLKKGALVLCGAPDKAFGTVSFDIAGSQQVKEDFNTAVELLHSFEYDEAEKTFAKIIDESPNCAMAYWGAAMCSVHPLWEPPAENDLKKGAMAIEIARSIKTRSARDAAYIESIAAYYNNWPATDAHTRAIHFEKAMEHLRRLYPTDPEATIFYALSLDASADPMDKTYTHQKLAGRLLDSLYLTLPNHPGIIHYIIHTYDYPGIAALGLTAARKYAAVAPASAHALHMPSHIFTRLGLWDECIQMNRRSIDAARCYAGATNIKGHWDEELHGLDYLIYAELQRGDNAEADRQLNYLSGITEVFPVNFKEAYTFAAAPCRRVLENKDWTAAAQLSVQPGWFPWARFPWQEAIVHFARLVGDAHVKRMTDGQKELAILDTLQHRLLQQNDAYKAQQVQIQIMAGKAWLGYAAGNNHEALSIMKTAAELEESTAKHPVTPGEVLPAREQYADLLVAAKQYQAALRQYQLVLEKSPNRFNSLAGAAKSAALSKDDSTATAYYTQLLAIAAPKSIRIELQEARDFIEHSRR